MHNVIQLTESDFDAQVLRSQLPVLVDFWAPWCGPCKMQLPVLEAVATRMGAQALVAKVNVDEAPALSARYGISSIPTLLLFKGGGVVRQLVGLQTESVLVGALAAIK